MVLYVIGLGLGDERDVTRKGADAIAASDRVFLEAYTSVLGVDTAALEAAFGKRIELAHRETVESESATILEPARTQVVSFLVVGDPFGATTHTDLVLRARGAGIEVRVVHNASIMNAIGAVGLQLYNYGATVSIPFWRASWQPESFYDKIAYNAAGGMHTLCLLDIKVREPDFDALASSGRRAFLPPRFMTVNTAARQLMAVEARRAAAAGAGAGMGSGSSDDAHGGSRRGVGGGETSTDVEGKGGVPTGRAWGICGPDALAVGVARIGQSSELIISGTLSQLAREDFGMPLHSLVLVGGTLHDLEATMIEEWRTKGEGVFEEPEDDWA